MKRTGILVLSLLAALAVPLAPARAADPAPVLTLTSDKAVYIAGQTATFTSHVEAMNLDWVLQVRYPGSTQWRPLCVAININSDTLTCQLAMYFNVLVRAQLIDDHGTEDTDDDTVVRTVQKAPYARAAIGTSVSGYYVRKRGYAVFGRTAKPTFASSSAPAFPGKRCLRHQIQRKYSSGWKNVRTSACSLEKKQGRVDYRFTGKRVPRVKYRIRATFAGDQVNLANNAAWVYFRFR